ncbi:MAG: hypothetical protein HQL14_04045 [Candidatus Omnitrophica bacterium]|nr:hypothetical protein [Candidatus Omnitrophota bacterium]
MTKIVFLLSSVFSQKDKERFGVEILQQNGFEVEVWDFTPFLNPWRWGISEPFDKSQFEAYRVLLTKKEALGALSGLTKDCLIICVVDYSYETFFLYRKISDLRLPYCLIAYNFPTFDMKSGRSNIFKRLANLSFEKLRVHLFYKIPFQWLGVKPAKIVLMLGGGDTLTRCTIDRTTEIIRSHYFDYDLYLQEIQKPLETDDHTAVFLDNYIPFHPDWCGPSHVEPEEYYSILCKFFDLLENKYGVRVVIAAHPRSAYEDLPDYFNGRLVIKGKTAELVRRSKFAIVHYSASVSFAALFNKPIIFVTTEKLHQTQDAKIIDFMAGLFNKSVINLNGDLQVDTDREFTVDDTAYKKYIDAYIKPKGTSDLPIWQVFANNLKNVKQSERAQCCGKPI